MNDTATGQDARPVSQADRLNATMALKDLERLGSAAASLSKNAFFADPWREHFAYIADLAKRLTEDR